MRRDWVAIVFVLLFYMGTLGIAESTIAAERYDLILKNGRVVDGAGTPWYIADLAVRDGKIAAIGRLKDTDAAKTIDASGLVVAPGFIDMMGQTGSPFLKDPAAALNLLAQGVTTINAGEGDSAAPLSGDDAKNEGWSSMREYFALLEKAGMPINVVQTVGHTQVRRLVLGEIDRRPMPPELEKMKQLVREAMEAGAIGVSTALIYPPAVYASTEEISDLARVAGEYGGGYYTHMRNEGDRLLEAIDEALSIGEAAACRVHIFHLKAAGRQNWGKMDLAIARIKAARAAGRQVAADIYPYINNGLGITAFIHPRHAAEGPNVLRRKLDDPQVRAEIRREMESNFEYENWYRHTGFDFDRVVLGQMTDRPYAEHNGKSLAAIAKALSKDPWDVFFDACRMNAFALPQTMTEANLIKAMREEFVSFCTDVGPAGGSNIASHPRAFGAFPRVLSRFVRDLGVISLERAVSQMTAVAANEVLCYDRGRLSPGLAADIVVFDYATIVDRATFAEPHKLAEGVRHVIVNGELVLEAGKFTGHKPGRVLRGPGYKAAP
jgi:N-acyl-D-aspartate/D-glutamate deacylase